MPDVRRHPRLPSLLPALALTTVLTTVLTPVLAACGDDGADDPEAVETVTETVPVPTGTTEPVEPTETVATTGTTTGTTTGEADCTTAPPAGSVTPPTTNAEYATGSVGLEIELSDGTTDCVTFEAVDPPAGTWETDSSPELSVELGSEAAGLSLTVTDYTDDGVDDIAAGNGDPFTGIQYDGFYFADSFHTGCVVEVLDLTATSSAGTFDCSDIDPFPGGGWNGAETDLTVVSATGWWSITA